MTATRDTVGKLFKLSHNRMASIEPLTAIFPGHSAPLVRLTDDGERELLNVSWGFPLLRKGYAPKRVTNTRDDKALTSSFWRQSVDERRCLVPATSFCEPDEGTPANWHWFAFKGDEPRPLFAFAGIWKPYKGPIKKNGETVEIDVFSFMTTTPNALVGAINHERMPVLLHSEDEFDTWMEGTTEEALALATPYGPTQMHLVQSGLKKEDLLS